MGNKPSANSSQIALRETAYIDNNHEKFPVAARALTRESYVNNNNRRLYYLSDRGLIEPLFTGTKFSICLKMLCFFLSSSFNNFCIYGMDDFLYLSVHVSFTKNFSWYLLDIPCNFSFLGNIDLNLSVTKHFSANLRQRDLLLSSKDWSLNSLRASLQEV